MKEKIRAYIKSLGVDDVGFAAIDDYFSPNTPKIETFFPKAKSIVVMAYRELSTCESLDPQLAMNGRMDKDEVMRSDSYKIGHFLEDRFEAKLVSIPKSLPIMGVTSIVSLRHAAVAAGLGSFGRHNLVIHPKFGTRVTFSAIITNLEIESDEKIKEDFCNNCDICVKSEKGVQIMKTTIYYFSGTGNSLKVAQDLANELGDTEVIPITRAIKEDVEISFSSDRVGIVYPVYIWGIPQVVSKFIKKISKTNKVKYLFAVATNHTQVAGSLLIVAKRLASRGLKLSAGFSVIMPNSYTLSQKEHSIDNLKPLFAASEKRLDEISLLIKNGNVCEIERGPLKQRIINTWLIYHSVSLIFSWLDIPFSSDNNCSSCGLCEKICPVHNIVLKNGKPIWLHKCEQCFRCINLCPKQSIQYLNKTSGKWRYKNPSIRLDDLIEK